MGFLTLRSFLSANTGVLKGFLVRQQETHGTKSNPISGRAPQNPHTNSKKSACRLAKASFLCANCVPAGPMACLLPYSCYD